LIYAPATKTTPPTLALQGDEGAPHRHWIADRAGTHEENEVRHRAAPIVILLTRM
jgi:hypothetical protein